MDKNRSIYWLHSKKKEVPIIALTQQELQSITDKQFTTDRLKYVQDIFLFCCYTGLSYIDVKQLKQTQVEIGVDNELWIILQRQKTGTPTRLPIQPLAIKIMKKYENHPKCKIEGNVLPVFSNQKTNEYLKEMASICGIHKNLTFHIARHTFATTVTLSNGVPIETVSKMLGHRSITQTQHYAKIQDLKVRRYEAIKRQN